MFSKLFRPLALLALLCAALPLFAVDIVYPGATPHSSGGTLGRSATDHISLYGSTTIAQPSGAAQAAVTDSTGGDTSATTLAAGVGITTLSFAVDNASIPTGDILSAYVPGYKFKILKVTYAVGKPATTGAKLATLTPKITGVAVTGGVLSLTSATLTPAGALVAGTAVTAANTGSATDSITVTASAVTTFVEGTGTLYIEIQNMDSADAAARTAALLNALRSGLVPTTGIGAIKGGS